MQFEASIRAILASNWAAILDKPDQVCLLDTLATLPCIGRPLDFMDSLAINKGADSTEDSAL